MAIPLDPSSLHDMYKIAIRKVSTGETSIVEDQQPWSEFWWTEGNGGCDCNRELFFEYGRQHPRLPEEIFAELHPIPCSDGRFTLEWAEENGEIVYGKR